MTENKKNFVLDSKSLKIKEILNQDFMQIEILAISEGLNRNKTSFTLEGMKKAIPTFYNKFIMGYYRVNNINNGEGVFEEHNSDMRYDKELNEYYWSYTASNAERPLGLVRESDKVDIIDFHGKKWITLTAVILTKYNREAVKHLLNSKGKRKVSVEITVTKSHKDENGIEIIEEFILDAITILGNRKNSTLPCSEGIEGASLKVLNFSEVVEKQKEAICFAYQSLDELSSNEKTEEIQMGEQNLEEEQTLIINNEEMEGLKMTYEQKREILESILREKICTNSDDYVWVCDMSETEVYYCYNGDFYKAIYSDVEDEEIKFNIETEDAVKVVRSWQEYSVNEEIVNESQNDSVENFSENESSESFESSEEEEENEKFDSDNEEENKSEDEVKEEEVDEDETKKENCGNFVETDSDDFVEEENKNEEENKEEENFEEKCEDEDCKDEDCEDKEDKHEMSLEEQSIEQEVVEVQENFQEKYEELEKLYNDVQQSYSELKENYSNLESKNSELQTEIDNMKFAQKNSEMLNYGYELIKEENTLDDTDKEALKSDFKVACETEKFVEEEQVKNFMETNIPKLFYARHKETINQKNNQTNQEEFSLQFNQTTKVVQQENSFDKMKNILKI